MHCVRRQDDVTRLGCHDGQLLTGRVAADDDRGDPVDDRLGVVREPDAPRATCFSKPCDLVRLDVGGELTARGERPRPEVELPSRQDELRLRERVQVPDVVVVEVRDDQRRHLGRIDFEGRESLDRRAEARAPPARPDPGVEPRVDDDRLRPTAEDPEVIGHLHDLVRLAVAREAVEELASRRAKAPVAHGEDLEGAGPGAAAHGAVTHEAPPPPASG